MSAPRRGFVHEVSLGLDVAQGQIRIDREDGAAHAFDDLPGIADGADLELHLPHHREWGLRERNIDGELGDARIALQTNDPNIANDADDFHLTGAVGIVKAKVSANRALGGKIFPRGFFAYDGDARRPCSVAPREVAAQQQRYPHRLEEARCDRIERHFPSFAGCRRHSGNGDATSPVTE